jgi:UPF0755 protein
MWHRTLGLLLLAASLAIGWVWDDYQRFLEAGLPIPAGGLVYTLPPGANAASLARDLHDRGLLGHPLYLRLLARQEDLARRLQAGEYRIPGHSTPLELLRLLASGRVMQHPVTLVEGWTFAQALAAVARTEPIRHTLAGLSPEAVMARLGRPDQHPEGRFLPDTYLFPRGSTDLQVLARALRAMDRTLEQAWQERHAGLSLTDPYQVLILASIVEKETARPEERAQIAGVFLRRLQRGMRLQTDPTVIYGLGPNFDGNLRRADLEQDTPYNSYTRAGLPPTPIALPGREAILATVRPADGNSLYFVAKGDGSHQFSATLEAHNRAVRQYQLRR